MPFIPTSHGWVDHEVGAFIYDPPPGRMLAVEPSAIGSMHFRPPHPSQLSASASRTVAPVPVAPKLQAPTRIAATSSATRSVPKVQQRPAAAKPAKPSKSVAQKPMTEAKAQRLLAECKQLRKQVDVLKRKEPTEADLRRLQAERSKLIQENARLRAEGAGHASAPTSTSDYDWTAFDRAAGITRAEPCVRYEGTSMIFDVAPRSNERTRRPARPASHQRSAAHQADIDAMNRQILSGFTSTKPLVTHEPGRSTFGYAPTPLLEACEKAQTQARADAIRAMRKKGMSDAQIRAQGWTL